jgi:hypothetical protein
MDRTNGKSGHMDSANTQRCPLLILQISNKPQCGRLLHVSAVLASQMPSVFVTSQRSQRPRNSLLASPQDSTLSPIRSQPSLQASAGMTICSKVCLADPHLGPLLYFLGNCQSNSFMCWRTPTLLTMIFLSHLM